MIGNCLDALGEIKRLKVMELISRKEELFFCNKNIFYILELVWCMCLIETISQQDIYV